MMHLGCNAYMHFPHVPSLFWLLLAVKELPNSSCRAKLIHEWPTCPYISLMTTYNRRSLLENSVRRYRKLRYSTEAHLRIIFYLSTMSSDSVNRYWIPHIDIHKRVITQELQYYLGPDATGEFGFSCALDIRKTAFFLLGKLITNFSSAS